MKTLTVYGRIHRWRIYLPDGTIIILSHDSDCKGNGWFQLAKTEKGEWRLIRHLMEKYVDVYPGGTD